MPHTKSSNQQKKILMVEDEGEMCLLLNIILLGKDIEMDHVKTLGAAKAYLEKEQPNLVMLDNRLPDGLGLDLIPFIRSNYPDIKILMISGFHSAEVKDIALETGADAFLEKPFTKEQIYKSVQDLLSLNIKEQAVL